MEEASKRKSKADMHIQSHQARLKKKQDMERRKQQKISFHILAIFFVKICRCKNTPVGEFGGVTGS